MNHADKKLFPTQEKAVIRLKRIRQLSCVIADQTLRVIWSSDEAHTVDA